MEASRVVLATGGLSLPNSGSDGGGLELARRLGHAVVPTTPALAPLVLAGEFHRTLSGVTCPVVLAVNDPGVKPRRNEGALLFTHFGISGPAALDASRHLLRARLGGREPHLTGSFLPGLDEAAADRALLDLASRRPRLRLEGALAESLPASLAGRVLGSLGLDGANYDIIGDIHSYRLGVSSSYNKYFSDRFVNYSSVGFGYGKNNDRTEHEESVGNSLTYLITPNLLLNNSLLAANRKDGYYFDGSICLTLTTRRTWTWAGYEFTADSFEETKLQKHRFNLSAGADMLRNLSILAESAYEIEDTDSFGASYQEKTITLRTEMFWRVSFFSITAG